MTLEDSFARRLMQEGIDEIPAKKAGKVLRYFHKVVTQDNNFPATQRIPYIWKGMIESGIKPYMGDVVASEISGLNGHQALAYRELDSIAIGVAVGVHKGLLNVCETTKYALSAEGSEFIGA